MLRDTLIKLQNLGTKRYLHTTDSNADSVVYTYNPLQYQSGTTSLGSTNSTKRETIGLRRHIVQTDLNPVSIKFGQYIFMSCADGGLYRINTLTNEKEHIFIGEDVCSRNGQVFDIIEYIKSKAIQTEDTYTPQFIKGEQAGLFLSQETLVNYELINGEETLTYIQDHCKVLGPRKIWKLDDSNFENVVSNPVSINDSIGLITMTEQYANDNQDRSLIDYIDNNNSNFFIIQESWTGPETNTTDNLILLLDGRYPYSLFKYIDNWDPDMTPFLTSDGWDSFQFTMNVLDNLTTNNDDFNTVNPEDVEDGTPHIFARSIVSEDIWPTYYGKTIPPLADPFIDIAGWQHNARFLSRDSILDLNDYIFSEDYNIQTKMEASFTRESSKLTASGSDYREYSLDFGASHVIYAKTELPITNNYRPVSPCDPVFDLRYNQYVPLFTPASGETNIMVFPNISCELTELKIKKHTRIGKILDLAICYNKLMVLTESSLWCSEDGIDFFKIHDNKGFNFYNAQALDTELVRKTGISVPTFSRGFAKLVGNDIDGWYIAHDYYRDIFPSSDVRVNYNDLWGSSV